jgi:lipopolysaccharide transport protein LptA
MACKIHAAIANSALSVPTHRPARLRTPPRHRLRRLCSPAASRHRRPRRPTASNRSTSKPTCRARSISSANSSSSTATSSSPRDDDDPGGAIEVRELPDGYHTAVAFGSPGQHATFPPEARRPDEYIAGDAERLEYDGKSDVIRFVNNASVRRLRGSETTDEISGNLVTYDSTTRSSASPAAHRRRRRTPAAVRADADDRRRAPPPRPRRRGRRAPRRARRRSLRTRRRSESSDDASPPPTRPHRLEAHGLRKSYGSRKVVDGVRLSVRSGEVVGLLGPNGAGKTTSFYMIVGLIRPDDGEITIEGRRVERMPIHQRSRPRPLVPAAGTLDLPQAQRRGEHPRRPRAAGRATTAGR